MLKFLDQPMRRTGGAGGEPMPGQEEEGWHDVRRKK